METQKTTQVSSGYQKKSRKFKGEDAVMKRAKEIEENLADTFPTFVKLFPPSYDCLGCMRIPTEFCNDYMPESHVPEDHYTVETKVTLLNVRGKEYVMNFISGGRRKELNRGWSTFSTENKVCVGDVLVFQLIEPLTFKVYVVRAKDFAGNDGTRDSKKLRLTNCEEEERPPLAYLSASARNNKKTDPDSVMERAKEVMASLPGEFPNCLQSIASSYQDRGCLKLPELFCHFHLLGNGVVTIVNGSGKEYKIEYLKRRRELTSGWIHFFKDNKLCLYDVLVFQLIGHFRMKVYIVRVRDAAHGISEEIDSVPEGHVGFPGSILDFQEVKGIEDFSIIMNGMNIDSEVSEEDKAKYYTLCCSQNSYLHDRLLQDINTRNWAATIVSKTVMIADSIKGCQFPTPRSNYESWDKILNSFEMLGLNVGFLRARLQRLMSLAFESEGAEICRRQEETIKVLLEAEDNIRSHELDIQMMEEKKIRLEMLREKKEELVNEMKEHRISQKCLDSFQAEVDAEW